MEKIDFKKMVKGWFIGNFKPTAYKTKDCEVAYKEYKKGDFEEKHMHKVATEITLIIEGEVLMNNISYKKGDIVVMKPGKATDFKAITDSKNVVVKIPCVKDDKYLID